MEKLTTIIRNIIDIFKLKVDIMCAKKLLPICSLNYGVNIEKWEVMKIGGKKGLKN